MPRRTIKNKIKKVISVNKSIRKKAAAMESQMPIKISPAGAGIKRVARKAVVHGASNAFLKRTYSGHEKAAFKAAAKRLRRRKKQ